MGRRKNRLLNPKEIKCKCGKWFKSITHNEKYCSDECKKSHSKNWSNIKRDFNKLNPHLCSICGCDNSGSRFKICLDCRIRYRDYRKKSKEKKKNE